MSSADAADDAAKEAWDKGFYISWLCLDTAENYQCTLRRRGDIPFMNNPRRTVYVIKGKGKTISEAIRSALQDNFMDILG